MGDATPYSFKAYQPVDIHVDGEHVVLNTGDVRPLHDACEAIRFINALTQQTGGGYQDLTGSGMGALQAQCNAAGGGPGGTVPPTTPPPDPLPVTDPGATDPGNGQPDAGDHTAETPQSLGAPQPGTTGGVEQASRDPGASDGRPLGQQYYAPRDPLPGFDVAQIVQNDGLGGEALTDALDAVLHNAADAGQPHLWFGRDDAFPLSTVADPVLAFTGQYCLVVTDVTVPSEPFALHLTRTYTSGEVSFGPFGYNWDHNYHCYLRPLTGGGAAIWTGSRSEDVYRPRPDGEFEPPVGVFRHLAHNHGGISTPETYTLTDREGLAQFFTRPAGWPLGDRIPLTRIEDRHGRGHDLHYDVEGRVERVSDAAGRFLRLSYGDCGLLEHVEDHTGRRWSYWHDDQIEHLVAVVTPPTDEHPEGQTTRLEYDVWREHPALLHNLVRVIDADGREVVENTYGTEPMTADFGRVVAQRYGPWAATFSAEQLQYVPRTPDAVNVPAWRVSVVDPGVLRVFTFNYRGDLLDERFRLVDDGSYRLVARAYRYDEQGNQLERREPNGLGMAFRHDAANPDPRARGNLLRAELLAPPTRPSPSRIVQRLTYEPQFHRLKTMRDETGATTTWEFDYETAQGGVGDVAAISYPDATLPDGSTQGRRETFTYDADGRIVAHTTGAGHRHEFGYAAAGPFRGFLTRILWDATGADQGVDLEYDAVGRRSAVVDGLGNRTETAYDVLDRMVSVLRPGPAVEAVRLDYTVDGRLHRHERPKGSFDDGGTPGPTLVDEHEYDTWGHLVATTYGANTTAPLRYEYRYDGEGRLTAMVDPLGTRTEQHYDERGRVVSRVEAAGAPEEADTRYLYDLNGNQTAVIDAVGHRLDYEYDAWDRLLRVTLPGASQPERSQMEFTLDALDHCTRLTIDGLQQPGMVARLFDAATDYDERGRPWRRRLGASTSTLTYDADERTVLTEDQRGGRLAMAWDGLNRVVAATDPGGNEVLRDYDAAGSLVRITARDAEPGGPRVMVTNVAYDARRRATTVTAPLGRASTIEYDARDLPVASVDPLGQRTERTYGLRGEILSVTADAGPGLPVRSEMAYDASGRLVSQVDGLGRATTIEYDRRDRRTALTYPDGRVHRFGYGMRRQLEHEVLPGGTVRDYTYAADASLERVDVAPGAGLAPTPTLVIASDGLRRCVRAEQSGRVLLRRYDDTLRLVQEDLDGRASGWTYDDAAGVGRFTYPDGRVDRVDLDLLRRPVTLALETPGADALTGATPAGTVIAQWTYGGAGRVLERTSVGGTRSHLSYDDAGRLTALTHEDGGGTLLAEVRVANDAVDRRRVVWMSPAPLEPRRVDLDGVSRVVGVADGLALAAPPSAATQAQADAAIAAAEAAGVPTQGFDVDAADARTRHQVLAPASTDTYALGAAGQLLSVNRAGGGLTAYSFDADGRCVRDDAYEYLYDGLDRLVEVRDLGGATLLTQELDPAGRPCLRTDAAGARALDHHGMRLVGWSDAASQGQLSFGLGVDEVAAAATGSLAVPLLDPAASVLAWVDDAGTVTERYRYDVFGAVSVFAPDGMTARATAAVQPGPAFAGYRLLLPGRYDARRRVYDPITGRFTTPDALGYADAGNLYVYAHHSPADLVDPTGEVALLLGLAVAAGVGLVMGLGSNAVRQGLQIHEGSRDSFSWGEMFLSGGIGAVAGPVLVLAPELAIPLAAYGAAGGVSEMAAGHYESGAFDIATSLLPFASKNVRGAALGEGSVFAPARGLGPIATPTARAARFGELGRATQDLGGRLWNERFYHGTTYYAALETVEQNAVDLARVRDAHLTNPAPPAHGPGLYFGREPGAPNVPGSPQWWADFHGGQGQGGGPAVLGGSLPRWQSLLLRREPGVVFDVPQQGFPANPASREVVFPLDGPRGTPPTGPGAEFNALARYRLWDPDAVAPSLDALWPALSSPVPWLRPPGTGGQSAAATTTK